MARLKPGTKRLLIVVLTILYAVAPIRVFALTAEQKRVFDSGVYYFDVEVSCSAPGATTSPATGSTLASAQKVNAFTGPTITPTAIILHWTAGQYDTEPSELVDVLRSRDRQVQLYVDDTGKLYQLTETLETRPIQTVADQGWNDKSIGIEIESVNAVEIEKHEQALLTNQVQYKTVIGVVRELMAKYDIAETASIPSKTGVFGHYEANVGNPDPGANFMAKVRADLASSGSAITSSPVLLGDCTCGAGSGSSGSGTLPNSIPAVWRDLINRTAPTYPDVDPRLVASVLWAEWRGWPEFKTSGWGVSDEGAAGPWQFIASSWASMGHDGDGDGRKDRDNPFDAVHAAFKHHAGSAGKPIAVTGFSSGATAETNFNTVVLEREATNLLFYAAKYNGRGAPDGTKLADFPDNENSNYVIINYWLLATNFESGWNTSSRTPVSAATGDATSESSNFGCGSIVLDGYSFPVAPQRKSENDGVPGMSALPCTSSDCHHDGTVAFDLSKKPGGDTIVGTPVYAITSGQMKSVKSSYKGENGCQSFQILGDDGYWYANLHLQEVSVAENAQVVAGQQVAVIGERRCTGNGSDPHLHIDRGCVKNGVPQRGGADACRDPAFKALINGLFEALPE